MTWDSIWLIIALATIVQGFILSLAIYLKSSKSNIANLLLSLFIFFVSFSMIGRISPFVPEKWSAVLGGIMDLIIFSYGPLSFFYLKALLNGSKFRGKQYWTHFIPLALFLIYLIYQNVFPQHYNTSIFNKNMDVVFFVLESTAILSNVIYLFIGYKMVSAYEEKTGSQLSHLPQMKYIKIFLLLISIIIGFWFFGFISKFSPLLQFGTVFSYNLVWISISCLTFAFAYLSFFEADIISIPDKVVKYEHGYFADDYYNNLKTVLEDTFRDQHPYLNPKLTLSDLATLMGENQRDLSRVINEHYKVNFYEFINTRRIQKFKELVSTQENNDYTIVSLAYESGFNSKVTFNSAFKKIMKCTPSEYIKEFHKKTPLS